MEEDRVGPAISVIVPTYNQAETLARCVESILQTSIADVEVVIVNDGSTDGTSEVLRSFDDPRVAVYWQKNLGVCSARNHGVDVAHGEIVTFLDSDDEALPGWLEHWVAEHHRGIELASCAVVIREANGPDLVKYEGDTNKAFGHLKARMLSGGFAIRRTLLLDVGGFREGLTYSEHTDLTLRLAERMSEEIFSTSWSRTVGVVIHRDRSRKYDPVVRLASAERLIQENYVQMSRSPKLLSMYFAISGVAASRLGQHGKAVRYLRKAIRLRPVYLKNYGRLVRALAIWVRN